uniref:Ig-like domain-containing protein n=1 Tax=Clytia hemisphaerica TaxID=252671 RepID=A0A7M5XF11_9CNID
FAGMFVTMSTNSKATTTSILILTIAILGLIAPTFSYEYIPPERTIRLNIGEHATIQCTDFTPNIRDLYWEKANDQYYVQQDICPITDCVAFSLKKPSQNQTILHVTPFTDDDYGSYICRRKMNNTRNGYAIIIDTLEIELIPKNENEQDNRTNCQNDAIVASDPRSVSHKPECTSDGRYELVQTMMYSGARLFWCVNQDYGTKTHKHFFNKLDDLPCVKKRVGVTFHTAMIVIGCIQGLFTLLDIFLGFAYGTGFFILIIRGFMFVIMSPMKATMRRGN